MTLEEASRKPGMADFAHHRSMSICRSGIQGGDDDIQCHHHGSATCWGDDPLFGSKKRVRVPLPLWNVKYGIFLWLRNMSWERQKYTYENMKPQMVIWVKLLQDLARVGIWETGGHVGFFGLRSFSPRILKTISPGSPRPHNMFFLNSCLLSPHVCLLWASLRFSLLAFSISFPRWLLFSLSSLQLHPEFLHIFTLHPLYLSSLGSHLSSLKCCYCRVLLSGKPAYGVS